MRKVTLTEEEFKKILSHEIKKLIYTPLKENMFSKNIFKQKLDEGLYKTYDIDFVIKHFCEYLNFSSDYETFVKNVDKYDGFISRVAGENKEEYIEFVTVEDPNLLKSADDALKLCGYYKAFAEEYCPGYIQAGYEKRNDKSIQLKTNKLYHITRRESVPKIKREGLVPKSRNKQTFHLERIYFFTKDYGEDGFRAIAEDLYKGYDTPFGFVVLEVDTDKLEGVVFHNDLNTENGVYTTDNIPVTALKVKYQYKK